MKIVKNILSRQTLFKGVENKHTLLATRNTNLLKKRLILSESTFNKKEVGKLMQQGTKEPDIPKVTLQTTLYIVTRKYTINEEKTTTKILKIKKRIRNS